MPPLADPLASLWPDSYEQSYIVWQKTVVLTALDNAVVQHINTLAQHQPEEHRYQALAILTVAASLVSIDGKEWMPWPEGLDHASPGWRTHLTTRATAVGSWDDVLTAVLRNRCKDLAAEYEAVIEGLIDPNELRGRVSSIEPS